MVELAIREEESAVGEEQAALLRSRLAADPLRFFLHTEATSGDTAAQKALARERAGRAAAEAASGEVIVRGLGARAAAAQAFLGAAVVCLAQVGEEVLWRALPPTPPPEVRFSAFRSPGVSVMCCLSLCVEFSAFNQSVFVPYFSGGCGGGGPQGEG